MREGKEPRLISDVIKHLDANAESYSVITPDGEEMKNINTWLEQMFPIASWGRIDWRRVPSSVCDKAEGTQQQEKIVTEICNSNQLGGDVTVVWTNQIKPGLRISLETLLRNLPPIIEEDWDTWIANEADGWCIEIYHDGEVCFARIGVAH